MSDLTRSIDLRRYTPARVSLATAGDALATAEVLRLQLAHAQARDAVHTEMHWPSLAARVHEDLGIETLLLKSRAPDRAAYLRHPDLGRELESVENITKSPCDLVIVLADGLSALALERHAIPLLHVLLPKLGEAGWTLAPVTLVAQGRVAVGDAVGEVMGAGISLVLIGERPGLSAADSLGAYVTWEPCRGKTDAERNCLSNIRHGGLPPEVAAERLLWLLQRARELRLTGTALKEGLALSG